LARGYTGEIKKGGLTGGGKERKRTLQHQGKPPQKKNPTSKNERRKVAPHTRLVRRSKNL